MAVTAFLHQKGGTGKSTLAIAAALALQEKGEPALLVDADPQGTASEWANRFGKRFGVESLHHIQPTLATLAESWREEWRHVIVDGPPSLSLMTESILVGVDRVIVPVRPSLPDIWALPWLAALVRKLRREGRAPAAAVAFNMYRGEPLEPLIAEMKQWGLPVWPEPIPASDELAALFAGAALDDASAQRMLRLLEMPGGE